MTMVPSNVGTPGETNKEVSQRHFFALKQYSKAIKELRKKVFTIQHDLRTILVASILIICFEIFHQNYESAAFQLKTTIRLIESSGKELGSNKNIDEDLLCAFDRLDIQTMSRTDPQIDLFTIDERQALKDSNAALFASMPTKFEDIATARNYFYSMARRHSHFAFLFRKNQGMSTKDALSLQKSPPSWICTDESVILEQFKALQECDRWWEAFQPLYEKHRTHEQKIRRGKEFLAVTVIRLHYLIIITTRIHMFDASELAWDKSLPRFTEIVDLCEDLLSDKLGDTQGERKREKPFVFEMQTLMALDNITKKCRDPLVRRKAIRLLVENPMREGVRDSALSAKVGEWVMNSEEKGMVCGFIGEKWRMKGVSVRISDEGQSAKVTCWVGGEDGERREEIIEL
jgi:hypothetical protein